MRELALQPAGPRMAKDGSRRAVRDESVRGSIINCSLVTNLRSRAVSRMGKRAAAGGTAEAVNLGSPRLACRLLSAPRGKAIGYSTSTSTSATLDSPLPRSPRPASALLGSTILGDAVVILTSQPWPTSADLG